MRSPQDHVGVVHNSNLCTEILLNTSKARRPPSATWARQPARHTTPNGLDHEKLAETVRTAVRMLDNVIDINYYPTEEAAKNANLRHRPVGLGLMGFQDALFDPAASVRRRTPPSSSPIVRMELISYHAILASSELAAASAAPTPPTRLASGTAACCRSTRWTS